MKRSHANEKIFDAQPPFAHDNNMHPPKMTEATNYASSNPMPTRLARLWAYIDQNCDANDSIQLELHGNILGIQTTILLFKDDIRDFSSFQEIGAPVITVYFMYDYIFMLFSRGVSNSLKMTYLFVLIEFRYLYRILELKKTTGILKFADPSTVAFLAGNRKFRAECLAERMSEIQKRQMLLIPWNTG